MEKRTMNELVNFLKSELWTELVHFKMCELNFELVHVESELSQHWIIVFTLFYTKKSFWPQIHKHTHNI